MRIKVIQLRDWANNDIVIMNEENWVVRLRVNQTELGCIICPTRIRKVWQNDGPHLFVNLIIDCVKQTWAHNEDELETLYECIMEVIHELV